MRGGLPDPIFAAGGIVLGREANTNKILVVHRRRYGPETALPKGKLVQGESPADAALREVAEETGCKAVIYDYAGTTHYLVKGRPKVVFYFIMEAVDDGTGPSDEREIEAIEWMEPSKAFSALTHRQDRGLVAAVFGIRRA